MPKLPVDWRSPMKGALAFQLAPFAIHPCDERRARNMLATAARDGASSQDTEIELKRYLESKKVSGPVVKHQKGLLRSFIRRRTQDIRGGWVLYKLTDSAEQEVVHIISGRTPHRKALEIACAVYEARELSDAAKFLCAKRSQRVAYDVEYYTFEDGAHWAGEVTIRGLRTYVLRKAEYIRCPRGFSPNASIRWKPKEKPDRVPHPTWEGLLIRA